LNFVLTRLLNLFRFGKENKNSHQVDKFLTSKKFKELQKMIQAPINNKSHYIQALMHRSFLEELEEADISNERLEYLGDSVLSLVVASFLYDKFPDEDEGFLTKTRARLVNRIALSNAAERIGLENLILIDQNLSNTFARASKTVLSDALEALIGAIYLDHGLKVSERFIHRVIIEPTTKEEDYLIDENYKSQLLEYAQANRLEVPNYIVIKEEGPQHDRVFTIKVTVGKDNNGIGTGKNKKTAEQNAAKSALEKILRNQDTNKFL
jgi:ribonuclease-3